MKCGDTNHTFDVVKRAINLALVPKAFQITKQACGTDLATNAESNAISSSRSGAFVSIARLVRASGRGSNPAAAPSAAANTTGADTSIWCALAVEIPPRSHKSTSLLS